MTPPATPHIVRRPALPLIWVVPLIALVVAGWMVARQFRDRGPEITIEFDNGSGVEAGKTELVHKGVVVGTVRDVILKPDLTGVIVKVRLSKTGASVAREGSRFWVVHPQLSLSGISGLETLVTGVRLEVRPGAGGPARNFRGLDRPPSIDDPAAGRAFILRTDALGSVVPGTPVFYRGVRVGVVETTRLSADATNAQVRVRIYNPYVDLVRTNTQFWDMSGLSFKIGLSGVDVRSSTLQSLVVGGIAFGTPDQPAVGPPALENTEFELTNEAPKEAGRWFPRIAIKPVDTPPEAPRSEGGIGTPPAVVQH